MHSFSSLLKAAQHSRFISKEAWTKQFLINIKAVLPHYIEWQLRSVTASRQISGKTIICKKKCAQTFFYKAKDSRQRVWNVFLPLGCLQSMTHLSQFPFFPEPPFSLSANPFLLKLPPSDPADGNRMFLCLRKCASQAEISGHVL